MKIELKGIKKTYVSAGAENLSVDVLKGFDVVIGQGEYVSFIGKSGCGKTTLLKIMGLLMSPTEGELFIDGRKISGLWTDELADIRRRRMGFVFQEYELLSEITALDNVILSGLLDKRNKEELVKRAHELSEYLEIDRQLLGKYPQELSGGEKQRVAIGSAVASGKEIIIFDEPTSGLDYRHMLEVSEKLIQLKEMKKTLFLITHDPELIYKCCTHLMFIEHGRILWHRPMDNEAVRLLQEFFSREKGDSAMAI